MSEIIKAPVPPLGSNLPKPWGSREMDYICDICEWAHNMTACYNALVEDYWKLKRALGIECWQVADGDF